MKTTTPNKALIICIVDDDDVYRFTAKRRLGNVEIDKELLFFEDGEDAIAFIEENAKEHAILPDVIFLDIRMKYMDGWEFLEEFKALQPGLAKPITIYVVSSSVDERDIERAKAISEVSDYIVKPITEEIFKERLKELKGG